MVDVSTITIQDFKGKFPNGVMTGGGFISYLPVWESTTSYVVGDLIYLNGVFYDCILDNTNQTPPNVTYWTVNTTAVVSDYITDDQITNAMCQAQVQFASCLLSKKDDFVKLYYCYLVAHILVVYEIPMVQDGACADLSVGMVTSQAVGSVSFSAQVPDFATSSSYVSSLYKTIYGKRYAEAIEGCAVGYFGFVKAGIDGTRIVNFQIATTGSRVATRNANNIVFFTNETPTSSFVYRDYASFSNVETDFGTGSDTARFASVIFQARPNIVAGGGVLYVVPLNGTTSATSGTLVTPDISGNLTTFQSTTDGGFTFSIDGVVVDEVLNLDFTGVASIQAVADIIAQYLENIDVSVTNNQITFTSKTFGANSAINLTAPSTGTDLTIASLLNVVNSTIINGTDSNSDVLTTGTLTTVALSANLANFLLISDGSFGLNVDGAGEVQISGLDFTLATTITDVFNIIDAAVGTALMSLNVDQITFSSLTSGSTSTVAITAGITGTDITTASYLDITNATVVNGTTTPSTGETISDAIARTKDTIFYSGIATNVDLEPTALEALATSVSGYQFQWVQNVIMSTEDIDAIALPNTQASRDRVRYFFYSDYNKRIEAKAGAMTTIVGVNFNGTNTTKTAQGKTINGLAPDPLVYDGLFSQLETAGCDYYTTIFGTVNFVISNGTNRFGDQFFNQLALELELEAQVLSLITGTNTKVPFTREGEAQVITAMNNAFVKFVNNGYLSAGEWTSNDFIGNDRDFAVREVQSKGYYARSTRQATRKQVPEFMIITSGATHCVVGSGLAIDL
jgi:hypothetical protein